MTRKCFDWTGQGARVRKPLPAELGAHHRSAILEARKLRATKKPRYILWASLHPEIPRAGGAGNINSSSIWSRGQIIPSRNKSAKLCVFRVMEIAGCGWLARGRDGARRRHKAMTGIWYTHAAARCTHPLGASFGATWSRWERGCRRSLLPAHFFSHSH